MKTKPSQGCVVFSIIMNNTIFITVFIAVTKCLRRKTFFYLKV